MSRSRVLRLEAIGLGLFLALLSGLGWGSGLKSDETVIFFPTSAWWSEGTGSWHVPVHGWIFEREEDSLWRRGSVALLHETLELDEDEMSSELFRQRAWAFLVDNERGKRLAVQLGGQPETLPLSRPNGHFQGELKVRPSLIDPVGHPQWRSLSLQMPHGDERHFSGQVQFIPPEGVSVVSDIDDTIKVSDVLNKQRLLENTFLKPFVTVPGMAETYQAWAQQGAAFHYVSGSPWQLYEPLDAFLHENGFPPGSFSMRTFRIKDSTFFDLFRSAESYKVLAIDGLFQAWPQRRFVLVGDSGEKDPEVYAEMAQRYPGQVVAILIRNVTAASLHDERFSTLRSGTPGVEWHLFEDVSEIASPGDIITTEVR